MPKPVEEAVGSWRTRTGLALVLLIAAFAAVLGLQWRASADVIAGDFTVTGPFEDNCSTALPATVPAGTTVCHVIAFTESPGYTPPLALTVDLPAGASNLQFVPVSGPAPTISGNTATYPVLTGTSTFTLQVLFDVTQTFSENSDDVCGATEFCLTADDASAQAAQQLNTGTETVTVFDFSNSVSKSDSGDPVPAAGGTLTYTIIYTHPAEAPDAAVGGVVITDTVQPPAGSTVTAIDVDNGNVTASCAPNAGFPLATPVMFTCSNTAPMREGETMEIVITVSVPANPGPGGRSWDNTANAAIDLDANPDTTEDQFSDQDTEDTSQEAPPAPVVDPVEGIENLVGENGVIRHHDVDPATEDAAGNDQGILSVVDDPDDARGSYHQVCLFYVGEERDEGITDTHSFDPGTNTWELRDTVDVSWDVTTTAGAATVSNLTEEVKTFAITDDEDVTGFIEVPCVRWASAQPGEQSIIANVTVGEGQEVEEFTVMWDGIDGDQPLVKEWNTIDSTKIVSAEGDVGFTLADNTDELDNWTSAPSGECVRDGQASQVQLGQRQACSARPNMDGQSVQSVAGATFIEYVFGSHDGYDAEIDGVEQTFTISGQCGIAFVEDPQDGVSNFISVTGPTSTTVLSSDKGVAFQILPDPDCGPGDVTKITITSKEDVQLRSDVDTAPQEEITVQWLRPLPGAKQPILAWAGQRVVLEHDWSAEAHAADISCEDAAVRYVRQAQSPGQFIPTDLLPDVLFVGNDDAWSFDECVSRVLYESQDPGEVDVSATLHDGLFGEAVSNEVDFLVYYMKFESVTTTLVPGSRSGHNTGAFSPQNPWDTSNDVTSLESNVSADVLVRVRVKGWFTAANSSGRPAEGDRPAGRWVMPDDWRLLAGGALAEQLRPNYDVMLTPGGSFGCTIEVNNQDVFSETTCDSATGTHSPVIGPFSLLDGRFPGDSLAPNFLDGSTPRETWLPDGMINAADAPMPPALVTVSLQGSGFLKPAAKESIYSNNPYYLQDIPGSPFLPADNYLWDTWGEDQAVPDGPYDFWTSTAGVGSIVYSAAGADANKTTPGAGKVNTGGYTSLILYSDNHGEVMAWVNGDAGLTMEECNSGQPDNVVSVSGWYCEFGDKVGSSTITATADYPDKKKHQPVVSAPATVDWTWGGIKRVRVADGESEQFKYVIFEVTDRDGFCDDSPSLHPVLGETVEFLIDAGEGRIVNVSNNGTIGVLGADATTTVMPTDGDDNGQLDAGAQPTPDLGVCQAWVRVSNSLLGIVNVLVTAHDPEGTVVFDEIIDFSSTHTYTLQFRWSLITWVGADGIDPEDALRGTGPNAGGTDIFDQVTAVYGWNAAAQQWLAFFPSGVDVPGANNLTALENGEAYWIAIAGPGPVSWTVVTNVD